MIKGCIFDMDGLLLESERRYIATAMKVSKEHHYDLDEAFLMATVGLNVKDTHALLETRLKALKAEYLGYLKEASHRYLFEEPIPVKKGALELLDYLDDHHILKAVATSTSRFQAERMLKNAQLFERFDIIVCGDEISRGKPDGEIYLMTLKRMQLSPEEVYVFEDSQNGILSAYNAGIKTFWVPDVAKVNPEVQKLATYQIASLDEAIGYL